MHVPVLKEYMDKASLDLVAQCINSADAIHHREYWNLLMKVEYGSTIDYGPRTAPTLSIFFDLMASLGVVCTQAETEWKTLLVDFEKTAPHQRDSAAHLNALSKYNDVSSGYFIKNLEQARMANLVQSVRIGNFPQIKKTFQCQPWVDDLYLMHRFMYEIDEFQTFTETELSMASSFLSTNGFSDALRNANTQMMATIELNKAKTGFTVHEAPNVGDDNLFGAILEPFKGKLVYVDFWATWCSPCRSGIARIAPLKEELDGKEIEFVYITGETSPLVTWQNSIPVIKGHHYRLTNAQWRYLCNKYNINGIPRYMLVGKDGQIINPALPHLDNEGIRNMLIQNM
jgi:thiol-disulfide isomerase/thioredoxin